MTLAPGLLAAPPAHQASRVALPDTIADEEFWRLVTTLSEPGGKFSPELMSNEDSAQYVIPALKQTAPAGGVYLGVGPEQNFTYIAAVRPALAFVLDIRRDNMLQHLMYKALFELSADRADFIARLFSRRRPSGLDARSGVAELFEAFSKGDVDTRLFDDNLRAVLDRLTNGRGFPLDEADRAAISRMMQSFQTAGPHNLKGFGDKNLTYVQAMTAADLEGNRHGYLASEEHFRIVRDLQRRNLVVPVVGDFAGDAALRNIGRHVAQRQAIVDVFYVSNVERYLYEQGARQGRFYASVATLPLGPSSTFIRSVTRDISKRLGFPLPEAPGHWWSLLSPIRADLDAVASGQIDSYPKLFEGLASQREP
jgi:hypothetical protein